MQDELNCRKSLAEAAAACGRSISIDTRQDWAAAGRQSGDSRAGPSSSSSVAFGGAAGSDAHGGSAFGCAHPDGDSPRSDAGNSMAAESNASSFGTCHATESATGYSPGNSWHGQATSPLAAIARRQQPQWTLPPTVSRSERFALCAPAKVADNQIVGPERVYRSHNLGLYFKPQSCMANL